MTEATPARRPAIILALVFVLPLAACIGGAPDRDIRGDVTVINRTADALTVTDEDKSFTVAGCGEASASNFRINAWTITAVGFKTFSSGGGSFGPHAYILVTVDSAAVQKDERPRNPPPCQGTPARLR